MNECAGESESFDSRKVAQSDQLTLLFIYGTLKRGNCRHHYLDRQRFLGEAQTEPCFRMVDCGDYPGLIETIGSDSNRGADGFPGKAQGGNSIHGELWEVDAECLVQLDGVEGVAAGLYVRKPISLQSPRIQKPVQTYLYARDVSGLPDCGTVWSP